MNLGIDFGSSFSVVSTCVQGPLGIGPEPINFSEGDSACIPTVACVRKGSTEIEVGQSAWQDIKREDYLHFRACKMLLNAKKSEWMRHDDYSDQFSPEVIAEAFLNDTIENALSEEGEDQANLVVCVPDVWAKGIRNPDPKSMLFDICQRIPCVNHVKIVTEPEAASAYSAFSYFQENNAEYDGMILIIDYGGGTLDLSLTQVGHMMKDGKLLTHIRSCAHGGQGENHDGQIGIAGIAYMTRVSELALCAAMPELAEEDGQHLKDYDSAVSGTMFIELSQLVETKIKGKNNELKKRVSFRYNNDPKRMESDHDLFFDVLVNGTNIGVTYAMLYQAYMEIVHDTLENELNHMDPSIRVYVDNLRDENQNGFKIALVGGFGKFALIEQQVYLHYAIARPKKDRRIDQEVMKHREYAIANGAALIADGQIVIRRTAPQSIGLVGHNSDDHEETFFLAIEYGQIMEDNQVYYVCHNGCPALIRYGGQSDFEFAINSEPGTDRAMVYRLNEEYWKKVQSRVNSNQTFAIGFQIDDSDVISMILSDYNNGAPVQLGDPIRLDCFERIFLSGGINFGDGLRVIEKRTEAENEI